MSDSPSFEIIDENSSSPQDSPNTLQAVPPREDAVISDESLPQLDRVESEDSDETLSEAEACTEEDKVTEQIKNETLGNYAKPLFSICIVGKNASLTLPRLMSSLNDFLQGGGQVLFYDTGSSDDTVTVAIELGIQVIATSDIPTCKLQKASAKYIKETFIAENSNIFRMGDYCIDRSLVRNRAAEKGSTPIQLHLSATDEIQTMSVDFINELIVGGANNFFFNICNRLPTSNVESFSNINHFYDRTKQRWEGCGVEELYSISQETSSKIQPVSLPATALNVIHWRDGQDEALQATELLIGAGIDVATHKKNSQMVHHLGMRLCYSGYTASALKTLTRHLQMEAVLESRRSLSACAIAQIWLERAIDEQQRVRGVVEEAKRSRRELADRDIVELAKKVNGYYENAKEYFIKAFYFECGWRTPVLGLADIALRVNDWERAVIWAKAAEQIRKTSVVAENTTYYTCGVEEVLLKAYYNIWKESKGASSTVQSEFYQLANEAYQHCKNVAPWLPFIKTYAEIFKHDQEYAIQHISDIK